MVQDVRNDRLEPKVNFCDEKYKCYNGIHTICKVNHNCRKKPSCLDSPRLTLKKKADILNKHNELRNMVALG